MGGIPLQSGYRCPGLSDFGLRQPCHFLLHGGIILAFAFPDDGTIYLIDSQGVCSILPLRVWTATYFRYGLLGAVRTYFFRNGVICPTIPAASLSFALYPGCNSA